MRKNLSGVQQRNKNKIAQANRRTAYARYADDATKERFKTPAYQTKSVHAN